ncbi:uncharacterized protein LOC127244734 [Andrographis paniculata]|uniref:uncharacterized protein LOC127244734 n=1 Tax=Andrographis paniculata TaxID=175694 RepID=UPI0021E91A37|nr:uncharacterized protein LOC127244734 [Andrographis paniculata]
MGKTNPRLNGKTRSEHKFEKKLQFYESVRSSVATKAISKETQKRKRRRQKKLKAYDLSSLSEYLPDVKAPKESKDAEFKLNCKSRNILVLKESNQFKTVVTHPVFQSDPLAAIHQHLQNTQPFVDVKTTRKNGKAGKKTKKVKNKLKDSQLMEI